LRKKGAGRGLDWRRPLPGRGLFTPRCGATSSYPAAEPPNRISKKFSEAGSGYRPGMFQNASRDQVRGLIDEGAQVVEVLPEPEYTELHLPGAINLPLKELDATSASKRVDPARPVVVYCWDSL